ncbi:MAG: TolC family protein [Thermoanaerobaculia bacterium]
MHRFAVAGLLPVLWAAPGAAQPSSIVTEAEFLSTLDESHPAVAEASEALSVARARVVAASTLENPVLGAVREDPSGPVAQTDWTISWQLPEADRRPRIAAREEAAGAAEARRSQELLSLRLTMREIFAEWTFAAARGESLRAHAERVEALAAREAARAERGEASGLEAHRLALAAAGLRARVAIAAATAEEARSRARSWYPGLPADAEPLLPPLPPAPELDEDHLLVRAARADVAAATLEREAAGRFVRSPELSLGWQRQEAGSQSADGPLFGLSWSLPLFGRNQAERSTAEAHVTAARARLERIRREVGSAREGAVTIFRRLAAAFADAEAALTGNERMLEGAEAAFRHGEASLTDLLETQRSATESELTLLELHQAALAAHRELERLAGSGVQKNLTSNPTPQEHLR